MRSMSLAFRKFTKSLERGFKTVVLRRKSKLSHRNVEVFEHLGPDDSAIDCGADVGEVTEVMGRRGAKVYAFEPNPYAFDVLQKRFADNPRVICLNKAVSDRDDVLKLFLHEKADRDPLGRSNSSSLLGVKSNINPDNWVEVEAINLADFIKQLSAPVALIKMDIEGAEFDVLDHLLECDVLSNVGNVFVETHEKRIPSLQQRKERLQQLMQERNITNVNLNWN